MCASRVKFYMMNIIPIHIEKDILILIVLIVNKILFKFPKYVQVWNSNRLLLKYKSLCFIVPKYYTYSYILQYLLKLLLI